MINLKKLYFRKDDNGNYYLVPAECIKEFDEWNKLFPWGEEYNNHPRTEEFENYVVEHLSDILLYIHPDNLP